MSTSPTLRVSAMALACLAATAVSAQDKADGQWRGSGGAALAATSGNTSTSSLQLSADALRATSADKISLGGYVNYAKNKTGAANQTTADKAGGHVQYDRNLTPALFAFGRLGLDRDALIDLNLRTTLAGGLGYKLVNTPQTTFELFAGLGYAADRYDTVQTIGGRSDTRFSRSSIYLGEASSHQLTPAVSFKQRLDLYPGLSGDKAVLAKFTAGLSVAMNRTMSLNVSLTDSYNSKPPAGRKSNDLGLFTGVNVKFGAI